MRAVIIDPWNRTVYATDKPDWSLEAMYQTLSGPDGFRPVDDINSVRVGRDQMLWLDGEGFLIPDVSCWKLRGYPRPLAGIGLILGITEDGYNKETMLEVDWVQSMVEWTNQVSAGELGPASMVGNVFNIGDPILKEKE